MPNFAITIAKLCRNLRLQLYNYINFLKFRSKMEAD